MDKKKRPPEFHITVDWTREIEKWFEEQRSYKCRAFVSNPNGKATIFVFVQWTYKPWLKGYSIADCWKKDVGYLKQFAKWGKVHIKYGKRRGEKWQAAIYWFYASEKWRRTIAETEAEKEDEENDREPETGTKDGDENADRSED